MLFEGQSMQHESTKDATCRKSSCLCEMSLRHEARRESVFETPHRCAPSTMCFVDFQGIHPNHQQHLLSRLLQSRTSLKLSDLPRVFDALTSMQKLLEDGADSWASRHPSTFCISSSTQSHRTVRCAMKRCVQSLTPELAMVSVQQFSS